MTVTSVGVTSPGTTGNFTGYVNDDPATGAKQDTGNASLSVLDDWDESGLPAGSATIGNVGLVSLGYSASATFTPANSAHTAPACNGAAQQFSSMGPSAGRVIITGATLEIDNATAEATAWRLYLYNVTPPSALSDTTTFDVPSGDRASFLGYIDFPTAADLGSTQWVEVNGLGKPVKLSGTDIFGYLVNLTTLTPANVAHIVTLHAIPV